MSIILSPTKHLNAEIKLPASKSISNRALLITALCHKDTDTSNEDILPYNISECDDTRVMVQALKEIPSVIDIGAAGTAMRFLTAYLCTVSGTHRITGSERMQQRPISVLVDALRQLGADITYAGQKGYPPLDITGGTLKGGTLKLPGNVSSQYISALLMIAPTLKEGLTLHIQGEMISRPYITMTLAIMNQYGAEATWISAQSVCVKPGQYRSTPFTVENDWSAASYWYAMMALSDDPEATVKLPGLFRKSLQGDHAVSVMFRPLGIHTTPYTDGHGHEGILLTRQGPLVQHLNYDFVNEPDLAQTMVVTCALMGIPFRFTGLQSLRIKETDRLTALQNELRKLGYVLKEEDGRVLSWEGERCPAATHPVIETYQDHRMAMAFAPACLSVPYLAIRHPEVVSKSYPDFWDTLEKAGFGIEEIS